MEANRPPLNVYELTTSTGTKFYISAWNNGAACRALIDMLPDATIDSAVQLTDDIVDID